MLRLDYESMKTYAQLGFAQSQKGASTELFPITLQAFPD